MSGSIALIGMAGCGKTSIGREVAARLGRPFLDVDDMISRRFGPIDELFKVGEPYFRQCESRMLLEACGTPGAVIATGGGTVTQPWNMEKLKESGVVVFIDRPIGRIAGDIDLSTRPLYVCGFEALYRTYVSRLPLYRKYADRIVDNSGSFEDACLAVSEIATEGKL